MKKELNRYYRSISRYLPMKKAQRQQIIDQIRLSVGSYLKEHPEADMAALTAHFGTPQEITSAYVENMDAPEILKKFRIRKAVLIVVCLATALALMLWVAALVSAWIDSQEAFGGFYDVGPITESIMEETK